MRKNKGGSRLVFMWQVIIFWAINMIAGFIDYSMYMMFLAIIVLGFPIYGIYLLIRIVLSAKNIKSMSSREFKIMNNILLVVMTIVYIVIIIIENPVVRIQQPTWDDLQNAVSKKACDVIVNPNMFKGNRQFDTLRVSVLNITNQKVLFYDSQTKEFFSEDVDLFKEAWLKRIREDASLCVYAKEK